MFEKIIGERGTVTVRGLGAYSLADTLECGQCFRHVEITPEGAPENYREFITVVGDKLIRVGQPEVGSLVFYEIGDEVFERVARPYFALDRSLSAVKEEILTSTDSDFLIRAADRGEGIAILAQDPWETLISFIISQNNNIPRIKGIVRRICAEYGVNLALHNPAKCDNPEVGSDIPRRGAVEGSDGVKCAKCATPCEVLSHKAADSGEAIVSCPLKGFGLFSDRGCAGCGICYTFPTPEDILTRPEGLLPAKCGFRYGYILAAAEAVATGRIDLHSLVTEGSFEEVVSTLKGIRGVGDKVASCVALFGLKRLEAFPIDVWMRRAIDTYFDGSLDVGALGRYAGIAQQYIFHYIRNIENEG